MTNFKKGDVVIISTGQAGTIWQLDGTEVSVLLRNRDIWYGFIYQIRHPEKDEDTSKCPIEVEAKIGKRNGNY